MFENKKEHILPVKAFLQRLLNYAVVAVAFISFSLLIGILGYHFICHLGWIDSFYNASMILGGMGPADVITTNSGKIFAACYALFSGIAFLGSVAILFAPLVHRFFHILHVDNNSPND